MKTGKKFTAFLVPANLPALKKTLLKFGWLKSSPHCSITAQDCSVSDASILGRPGMAYEDMVLPFRVIEDVLLLGLILGGLERMYTRSLETAKKHYIPPDKTGRSLGMLAAMEAVSLRAAQLLDAGGIPASGDRVVESLAFEFRKMAREFLSILKTVAGSLPPDEFETDISRLIDPGKQVSFIKQQKIGDDLLVKGYDYGLESR
jgi:alkylation response protein AidB-like acyl-CoA dehydrogenase